LNSDKNQLGRQVPQVNHITQAMIDLGLTNNIPLFVFSEVRWRGAAPSFCVRKIVDVGIAMLR
jgi:hypothetical protein